jgi:hypothetical protein
LGRKDVVERGGHRGNAFSFLLLYLRGGCANSEA